MDETSPPPAVHSRALGRSNGCCLPVTVEVSRRRLSLTKALVRRGGAVFIACVCAVSSTVCCTSLRLCSEIGRTLGTRSGSSSLSGEELEGRDETRDARTCSMTSDVLLLSLTHSPTTMSFLTTIARAATRAALPLCVQSSRRPSPWPPAPVHTLLDYSYDVHFSLVLSPSFADSMRVHRPLSRTSLARSWKCNTASTARCTRTASTPPRRIRGQGRRTQAADQAPVRN